MHKIWPTYITLDFGHMHGVQHLGIIINAEGSNHLSPVLLILLFILNLQEQLLLLSQIESE